MLTLNNLSYSHPNRDLLFDNLNLTINKQDKIALVGNNGTGKTTLLKIFSGYLYPLSGTVESDSAPYYIPQHFGQFNDCTVAQALHIEDKLRALNEIMGGHATETNLALLNDDWLVEERCNDALQKWNLGGLDLKTRMNTLSGGQKTKVFLAGIAIHQPEIVLLDEPSNHLDLLSRSILYDYITTTSDTLVVVSHDKTLLNLLHTVYELSPRGISIYGGNYDFYEQQKRIERDALNQDLRSKEKALRKARGTERESVERKQKLDARGRKKQEKAGLPKIVINTLKDTAEKSTAHIREVHSEKVKGISEELKQLRQELPIARKMEMDLNNSKLHRGKRLIEATNINFNYTIRPLWRYPLSFLITSGDRVVIKGANGSGKTTLIKIILGNLHPQSGVIDRAVMKPIYIDQDYSLIGNQITVYEQAQHFNYNKLQEHELKIRLNRFLFPGEYWDKPCKILSGGEKMRLALCCLVISHHAPDVIILDEPTNNLDIQNMEILTASLAEYKGTLIIVSHDQYFLQQMNVQKEIILE